MLGRCWYGLPFYFLFFLFASVLCTCTFMSTNSPRRIFCTSFGGISAKPGTLGSVAGGGSAQGSFPEAAPTLAAVFTAGSTAEPAVNVGSNDWGAVSVITERGMN